LAWNGLFAQRTQGLMRLPPTDAPIETFKLDFRGGQIDPASLPHFEIQKAYVKALQKYLRPLANHFDPLGYRPLREEIARSLVARGIRCSAADILVTNGAQQGLDLIARALVDRGDAVVVERPGYFGATLAFRGAQAHLLSVPVDDDGMRVDELMRLVRTRRIKLIYTTPAVQMPTGATLSESRRRVLLDLADREQIPILEDDYDGEFRVDGPVIPALKTADPSGQVIYVGTLTKVLYPGLRLGYVVAARPLLAMLARIRFTTNFQPSLIDQVAVAEFMISGEFGRHVRRLRKHHTKKRNALLEALDASMPSSTRWSRPVAGSTVWVDLPQEIDMDALHQRAEASGLAFNRGDLFGLGTGEPHGIGLTFGSLPVSQLRQGGELLGRLVRDLEAQSAPVKTQRGARGTGKNSRMVQRASPKRVRNGS
jgi:DNA-binding transcriptional MocR family regulator